MSWADRGAFIIRPAVAIVLLFLLTARGQSWPLAVLVLGCVLALASGIVSELRTRAARANPCKTPCTCGCGLTWLEATQDGLCGSMCRCGCDRPCHIHKHHRGPCGS